MRLQAYFSSTTRLLKVPGEKEIELALEKLGIKWHWKVAKDKLHADVQKRKHLMKM